jgi:hypothetical protein
MNTMRNYMTVWVTGLVAGMILMARWQRSADGHGASNPEPIRSRGDVSPSADVNAPTDAPNLLGLVVTGAKLDVQNVRRWVTRTRWTTPGAAGTSGTDESRSTG